MKRLKSIVMPVFILGSLFVFFACNNKPNDDEIMADVNKRLQDNQSFSGITAMVKDGVVTLNGTCEGEDCATQVEHKIKEAEGVAGVQNNINKEDATDLTLRTSVQSVISKYEGVQADVAGGMIVLRGSIDRNQVQPLMNELEALKPKKLDNQLAIKQ